MGLGTQAGLAPLQLSVHGLHSSAGTGKLNYKALAGNRIHWKPPGFCVCSFVLSPAHSGCFASVKCIWKEHTGLIEMVTFLMLTEVAAL